ncbi:MAG: hypothetical protein KA100_00870 [Rickettsiales bacterium]|nr:hypothetical protein [Rickettsiales bacterium]
MLNNNIVSSLISLAVSIGFIALVIFLLPSLLILFGALILLSIIAAVVMRLVGGRNAFKTNFIYIKRGGVNQSEELYEMKDVTNSSKKRS